MGHGTFIYNRQLFVDSKLCGTTTDMTDAISHTCISCMSLQGSRTKGYWLMHSSSVWCWPAHLSGLLNFLLLPWQCWTYKIDKQSGYICDIQLTEFEYFENPETKIKECCRVWKKYPMCVSVFPWKSVKVVCWKSTIWIGGNVGVFWTYPNYSQIFFFILHSKLPNFRAVHNFLSTQLSKLRHMNRLSWKHPLIWRSALIQTVLLPRHSEENTYTHMESSRDMISTPPPRPDRLWKAAEPTHLICSSTNLSELKQGTMDTSWSNITHRDNS